MELQQNFSDSTPRDGSDRLQQWAKSLLSALQLISISQKYGSGHFYPSQIARYRPIGRRLMNLIRTRPENFIYLLN